MRKQAKKSIFIYLFLGVSCLFISRNHTESYWSIHEGKTQRAPSSQELLSNSDPLLLRDFFSNNNKMRIELWTDRNDESIKKQGRLALEQALSKTLLSRKMSNLSKEIFEKNMIESFSKNFLSSLALLKVVGGTFQIDLHFEPSEVNNFIEIMNTNQLIDQSSRGSLLNAIEQRPISFGKKILARIPQKQESRYHSLGGSITLWFKIQEQNLNIKENLTEGFVKYRRYFSMKREWTPELHLDGDGASLKGKWENSSYPRVLTVDITSPLNLESLIPKPGKLEVFYGKIKFPQKYETGLLRNIDIFSKDINVNKFLLLSLIHI